MIPALIGVGVLVALVVAVLVVGSLLPEGHVAVRSAVFKAPAEKLYERIADFERHADWRPQVKKIEKLADRDGHPSWRETNDFGVMTFERLEADPPRKLVSVIADPDLPFGGSWTFELAAAGEGGTKVTITERGTVKPAFFRFMARFVFGYTSTMDAYLSALGKSAGEDATPGPG